MPTTSPLNTRDSIVTARGKIAVTVLETAEKVKKNRDDLKELCEDILEIITTVREMISAHGDTAAVKFKDMCEKLERCLQDVLDTVKPLQKKSQGFHGRIKDHVKQVVKLSSTADQIANCRSRIGELCSNFLVKIFDFIVLAIIQIRNQVPKDKNAVLAQVTESINNCPPPSRIFHGRQVILDRMHEYFNRDLGKQRIYLLHGSGGSGKTQIALKFVQESSQFSDIFMIDVSTTDTLDAALKNIAVTKNVGDTPQDALKWLARNWLLFFDNADDPNINLNSYFPQYMEEVDAVQLLLKSAAQKITAENKKMAAEIAKISVQVHHTVYTTWEISFKPLSQPTATLLQLCSFLHHQGISEKMLSEASTYKFTATGPSKEELEKPQQFITQFLGPTGVWDFLRFMDVTTELRAYSLINYDVDSGTFSIHPLVHSWRQSTLAEQQEYHHSIIAIVGMSIAHIPDQDFQLASLWLLPHIDALLEGGSHTTPDFNYEYGKVYYYSGRPPRAVELETVLFTKQREILGEDHLDTLWRMGSLAVTYTDIGQLNEAEKLEVVVLEKQRKTLGEDHHDTLQMMNNLANTYRALGQLKEVEKLEVVVIEKQIKILGEDYPDTLTAIGNLMSTYHEMCQLKEAEGLGVMVLEKRRTILGEDHPDMLQTMGNLASMYSDLGQWREAWQLEVVVLQK
ncbi:hypothetical protein DFH07DRAFT_780947 [Mycena maculata]|uniref:DUF7779 domain-containing protein n=1 Tax=Mycena maculata TaxID=230809 RepID=A0AAD7MVF3_9AGAR|nr:hypothetical protein DFH07DRAFT_780947 [Mycena maculata]